MSILFPQACRHFKQAYQRYPLRRLRYLVVVVLDNYGLRCLEVGGLLLDAALLLATLTILQRACPSVQLAMRNTSILSAIENPSCPIDYGEQRMKGALILILVSTSMSLLISQSETPAAQTSVTSADAKNYLENFPLHLLSTSSRDNSPQHIMIQRTLLRQSRVFSSSLRFTPRTSLARPQFLPQTSLASISRTRPLTSSRWYSTEPEARNAEGEAAPAAAEAADPVKKELEEKNKEILDLKVCATLRNPFQSTMN
jgi:hypothetical protein